MLLAYDYPLLGVFWSMLIFSLCVGWLMALFHMLADIFRSRDLGGLAKAAWSLTVLVLPFFGVAAYLLARGDVMARRAMADAEARDAFYQEYVQDAAVRSGAGDQIGDSEYEAGKAKVQA